MSPRVMAVALVMALTAAGCGGDASSDGSAVTVDAPSPGTQVGAGASLTVQVTARDDAGVGRIDLQVGGQTVASMENPGGGSPFTGSGSFLPAGVGAQTLVAVAYRVDGSVIGSAQVAFSVLGEGETLPTGDTTATGDDGATTTVAGGGGTPTGGDGTPTTAAGATTTTAASATTTTAASATTTTAASATTTTGAAYQIAPFDNDSLQNPAVYYFMSPTQNQAWSYQDEVSFPDGDHDDWVSFEFPNASNTSSTVKVTLNCALSGDVGTTQLRATLFEDGVGSTTQVLCGSGQQTVTINNTKKQVLRIHLGNPSSSGLHASYEVKVCRQLTCP